jgi:hypothetical protein
LSHEIARKARNDKKRRRQAGTIWPLRGEKKPRFAGDYWEPGREIVAP